MTYEGRSLLDGKASGPVAAIPPLSFWGGYDPASGLVSDRSHAAVGRSLAGTVLVMTAGRGSSSSSTVLAEAIRLGTAPVAIVLAEPDSILLVGALVAETLYRKVCPIVVVDTATHAALASAAFAGIEAASGKAVVIAR